MTLGLLTECFILVYHVAMFGARVWLHVSKYCNFGTLKESGLKINTLPFNCFSYRNVLQNGVNAMSKKKKKKKKDFNNFCFFCHKSQELVHFEQFHLVQILPACDSNKKLRDFRLTGSAFATVARKSFRGKFTAQISFLIGHFMLLKVWSLSIHYLICIWTICWWNLNKIAWYTIYKVFSFFGKNLLRILCVYVKECVSFFLSFFLFFFFF